MEEGFQFLPEHAGLVPAAEEDTHEESNDKEGTIKGKEKSAQKQRRCARVRRDAEGDCTSDSTPPSSFLFLSQQTTDGGHSETCMCLCLQMGHCGVRCRPMSPRRALTTQTLLFVMEE